MSKNEIRSFSFMTLVSLALGFGIFRLPVYAQDASLQADSFTQTVTINAQEPGSFSIFATASSLESPKSMPMQKVDASSADIKSPEIKSAGMKPADIKAKGIEPTNIKPDGVKSKLPDTQSMPEKKK